MKAERIVLSIIAILIGLFVAGIVFFVFQMSQNKNEEKNETISILPSPSTSIESQLIKIESPENETVTTEKTITLKGKAPINSMIIIATENGHSTSKVDENGFFNDEITLDSGVNIINITAVTNEGKEESIVYTISYTTESF